MNLLQGNIKQYDIAYPAIPSAGVYYFTTDSGMIYEVRFGRKRDNILQATIVFGVTNDEFRGEEYVETNKGEVFRVMATISTVIRDYMKEHPNMISYEFTGLSKDDENEEKSSTRIKLYYRYAQRIFFEKFWKIGYTGKNAITVMRKE